MVQASHLRMSTTEQTCGTQLFASNHGRHSANFMNKVEIFSIHCVFFVFSCSIPVPVSVITTLREPSCPVAPLAKARMMSLAAPSNWVDPFSGKSIRVNQRNIAYPFLTVVLQTETIPRKTICNWLFTSLSHMRPVSSTVHYSRAPLGFKRLFNKPSFRCYTCCLYLTYPALASSFNPTEVICKAASFSAPF